MCVRAEMIHGTMETQLTASCRTYGDSKVCLWSHIKNTIRTLKFNLLSRERIHLRNFLKV